MEAHRITRSTKSQVGKLLPTQRSNGVQPTLLQEKPNALQGVVDHLIGGVLILTEHQELIYANDHARHILRQLNSNEACNWEIPQEIEHICQSLIHSRSLFPEQHWLIESEIFANESTALHISVRWFQIDSLKRSCLLLTVKDRYQAHKNIAAEEAQKYGLTTREKEVWLLYRANFTYKQIAVELSISTNTVKKHMRSIHAKRVDIEK